ncbi:hypothetical protein [Gemmatimonas phototrophica]|uniref:Outer membrane protein beta-barrel domain-containing protein n=1 Tax=Gemmatimonas phototrophica TaxID=1379270 RepID=A0A143BGU0_9BACT|nr:hypothetical protein [Gemmatimonas phototrophica]AMW03831.1 hypothetical protein GEMMAAP_01170 [Gemmatimonas phototrophica]
MPITRRHVAALALGALVLTLPATPVLAQGPGKVVSINPFLPLAGFFQGEFEGRIKDNLAVAVSASHIQFDDIYTNADVKLRLYPQERGLQGFAIATGLGYGRIRNENIDEFCTGIPNVDCAAQTKSTSGATFSVEMHYQWLLGKSRNTAVTLGGGAKRYYIGEETKNGFDNFQEYLPTLRLTVGYAFR